MTQKKDSHFNLISQKVELTALTKTQKTYTIIVMTINKHLASSIALYNKHFNSDDRQLLLSNHRRVTGHEIIGP